MHFKILVSYIYHLIQNTKQASSEPFLKTVYASVYIPLQNLSDDGGLGVDDGCDGDDGGEDNT